VSKVIRAVQFATIGIVLFLLPSCSSVVDHVVGTTLKFTNSFGTINPLSARVKLLEYARPSKPNGDIYLLVPGIYGNRFSFGGGFFSGGLVDLLREDHADDGVYIAEYWSTFVLPNFRSLVAIGESFEAEISSLLNEYEVRNVFIVAHSQGGLLSRYAMLELPRRFPTTTFHLMLFGTPSLGSEFATIGQKLLWPLDKALALATPAFVIGLIPLTTLYSVVTQGDYVPAVVLWNHQAYDMRPESRFLRILNQLDFFSGVNEPTPQNLKVYSVIGTDSFLGSGSLDDGIVGFRSAAYPARLAASHGAFVVPYRHFGGIVSIDKRSHHSYSFIDAVSRSDLSTIESYRMPTPAEWRSARDFRGGLGYVDLYYTNTYKYLGVEVSRDWSGLRPNIDISPQLKDGSMNFKGLEQSMAPVDELSVFGIPKALIDFYSDGWVELYGAECVERANLDSVPMEIPRNGMGYGHSVIIQKQESDADVDVLNLHVEVTDGSIFFPDTLYDNITKIEIQIQPVASFPEPVFNKLVLTCRPDDIVCVRPQLSGNRYSVIAYVRGVAPGLGPAPSSWQFTLVSLDRELVETEAAHRAMNK
jgi:pimeloyl-ACP methyl ester carboxylesterase